MTRLHRNILTTTPALPVTRPERLPLDVAAIAAYTAGVRRAVRANRARRLPPTPWPDCGTDTAYHRHVDAHEHTCEPCRDAHNLANRAARRKSTP